MPKLQPAPQPSPLAAALSMSPGRRSAPLWAGPCGAGPQGGVTFSMLSKYLCCKERFRVRTIEGLKAVESFHPKTDYGNLWHAAEEAHAAKEPWLPGLRTEVARMAAKFPMDQDKIVHCANLIEIVFAWYVEHWKDHPDVKRSKPLLQEQKFDVSYPLPSGRTVRLRCKMDSIDYVSKGGGASPGIWVQENKSKGEVDEGALKRQLKFDLQSMTYLVILETAKDEAERGEWASEGRVLDTILKQPLRGVRYNAVHRSDHKILKNLVKKLEEDRAANRMAEWFLRLNVEVSEADIAKFRRECLDPLLENLSDDYEWWAFCKRENEDPYAADRRWEFFGKVDPLRAHLPRHFRYPYGIYNPLNEAGFADVDDYLESGSMVGLRQVDDLFPELK